MEKINMEIIISSLLLSGFDKVDSVLFTLVLGKIVLDNVNSQKFKYEDEKNSKVYNDYINHDGVIFNLKEGITLDMNVSPLDNHVFPLRKALHTSKELLEYFAELDFNDIVSRKIESFGGYENISPEKLDYFFSNKEKEIIENINSLKINNQKKLIKK
ncbi:MAG: hypothetical protein IJ068_03615 [Bacilli bacterium]|nr:hypothetical protein [Bacilli bacterium]